MPADANAVEAVELTRTYEAGPHAVLGLAGVSLTVAAAEVVAVMGPSGSGKSTLLSLLGGLDRPDSGSVRVTGVDWQSLKGRERARFRRRACGFVAQGIALLPQATAAENVEVPMLLAGRDREARERAVGEALERVGLAGHADKLPDQLSGGEQQRVAIARALINHPALLLADEPTGNLDSATGHAVMQVLLERAGEQGSAIVLVTHDPAVAEYAQRVITMHSGRLGAIEGSRMGVRR
jgi:ABC-type lipoprotein export system ATPase subunit